MKRCLTLLLVGICASATMFAELTSDEKSFLKDAAEGSNAEIALAQLALKKTDRVDIKALAHRILTDHQKANEQLKAVAAANKIEMPTGMGLKYSAERARLDMEAGRDFENDYVNTMVKDHQADIAAFEKAVQNGSDADLKKFASMTIPILRQHLSMARTIQGNMVTPK